MIDGINEWLMRITVVEWVVISTFILLLGTTMFAALHKQMTVSNTLKEWGHRYNWFAFTMGALTGHWFFPNAGVIKREWLWLLIPMAVLGLADYLYNKKILTYPKWLRYSGLWVTIGIIMGMMFWESRI